MKDYLKDMVIYFLNKFQIEGENFKIIHCNNAGENEDLGNSCTKYFVVINLEVASPETLPKQKYGVTVIFNSLLWYLHNNVKYVTLVKYQ